MPTTPATSFSRRWAVLLLPLLAGSCAGLARNDQGLLQPQTVQGPCQVKKFYILGTTAVNTDMTVMNTGAPCSFTVFNADQQVILDTALVSTRPQHGQAQAGVTRPVGQALVSYTPQPGYAGPDRFDVTIEPNDLGIILHVTVQPPG